MVVVQDERSGADALPAMVETAVEQDRTRAPASPRSDASPARPGDRIGRYVLIEQVGKGAMGTVYAAYDPDLDRRIALKLLHGRAAGEEQRARLQREAQAMARVSHPNVVHVYEVGRHETQVYLAMEYIEGLPLSRWLEAEDHPLEAILEVFIAAGRGLAAAHEAGLVHRDFKPDNVLVDAAGRPRVLDFGLAQSAAEIPEDPSLGAILGTPAYMPAEQWAGLAATDRSDQFAFCVSLWSALAGERPFAGDTPAALAFHVQQGKRRAMPTSRGVPTRVREALERGLSLQQDDRWPSMDALLEVLEPTPPGSGRWLAAGLGIAAVLAIGLAFGLRGHQSAPDPCAASAGPMDAAWTAETREAVRASIEGSGSPSAAWVASGVERSLDGYAEAWRGTASRACKATHHERAQSERMLTLQQACLDRSLAAFDGLTHELAASDAEAVEQALQAVRGLPSIERCGDTEALLQAVAPPEDPQVASRVAELHRDVARAESVADLGRYAEAERLLEATQVEASKLDYLPLQGEVAVALASNRVESGRTDEMEGDARRAFELAVRAGDPSTAHQAAVLLADALGTWGHRDDAAAQWLAIARSYLALLPEPRTAEEARLLAVEGNVAFVAGRYDEARSAFAGALELHERLGAELEVALRLNDLAVVATSQDRLDTARDLLTQSRQRTVAVLGEDHPQVGLIDQNLGTAASRAGRNDEAIRLLRAAMANAERNRSREHPSYSVPLISVARIHLAQGELDEAREEILEARELLEGNLSERYNYSRANAVLAEIELARDDVPAALAAATTAVEVAEVALGADHSATVSAREVLARVEAR